MKLRSLALLALALSGPVTALAQAEFRRPECAVTAAVTPEAAEARCIRESRKSVQDANFAALQKTGLMFKYMARPELERYPEAKSALEKKVEGAFTVTFDVAPDGTVYNVATKDVTAGIEPLASMWADTIRQWTFAKVDRAVTGIEHRRIYLYPAKDEPESTRKSRDEH
jgi:hypothetical protein